MAVKMNSDEIANRLEKLINKIGKEEAFELLEKHVKSNEQNILTIVTNLGPHKLPDHLIVGDLYIASEGDFDLNNQKTIEASFSSVLSNLSKKLKEKDWHEIHVIPFGPSVLNMMIKLVIFRVTYSDTFDYVYSGNGQYRRIKINSRKITSN